MGLWDDIVIGSGNKGNTAICVRNVAKAGYISHNAVSFWVSDAYLDTGMTIFKDTPEGKHLQMLLDNKVSDEELDAWLISLVLTRLPPSKLLAKVEAALLQAHQEGREAQALYIRQALMIPS